jgi:hypothetical protein
MCGKMTHLMSNSTKPSGLSDPPRFFLSPSIINSEIPMVTRPTTTYLCVENRRR